MKTIGSTEMTIILAAIVVGVLQIALFFKLWGLCDNIAKMKDFFLFNQMPIKEDIIWKIRANMAKGDKEQAASLLIDDFLLKCKEKPSNKAIAELKVQYKKYFEQIGMSFPASIEAINTKTDLVNLFKW